MSDYTPYLTPIYPLFEEFLPSVVLLALPRVNHRWRKHAEQSRRNRVLSRRIEITLENVGHSLGFRTQLWDSNAVLSGSFLLWAILGCPSDWRPHDLDVYRPQWVFDPSACLCEIRVNDTCKCKFSKIENLMWCRAGCRDDHYSNRCYNSAGFSNARQYMLIDPEIGVARARVTHHTDFPFLVFPDVALSVRVVQCMEIQSASNRMGVARWILNNFDLDFLKITYDGKSVIVHDLQSVIHMTSKFTPNNLILIRSIQSKRIEKYIARGFTISNQRVENVVVNQFELTGLYLNDQPWCASIDLAKQCVLQDQLRRKQLWLSSEETTTSASDQQLQRVIQSMMNLFFHEHHLVPLDQLLLLFRQYTGLNCRSQAYLLLKQTLTEQLSSWHVFKDD